MFDRVHHVLRNETTDIPPASMLTKAWHQEYDVSKLSNAVITRYLQIYRHHLIFSDY